MLNVHCRSVEEDFTNLIVQRFFDGQPNENEVPEEMKMSSFSQLGGDSIAALQVRTYTCMLVH